MKRILARKGARIPGTGPLLKLALVGALSVVPDWVNVAGKRVVGQPEWPKAQRGPALLKRHFSAVELDSSE